MHAVIERRRRRAVEVRVLNEKAGLAIRSDDKLHRLVVPAIEAAAHLALLCKLGKVDWATVIEVHRKCGLFDHLEVVSIGRADCQQLGANLD